MKKYLGSFIPAIMICQPLLMIQSVNAQPYSVNVITTAIAPTNSILNHPFFIKDIHVNIIRLQVPDRTLYEDTFGPNFKIVGKLQRLSPGPFSIELKESFVSIGARIFLVLGTTYMVKQADYMNAFGLFNQNNLDFNGVSPNDIIQPGNNYKLPDGLYNICFSIKAELGGPNNQHTGKYKDVSNPQLGCASFSLCSTGGSAPQFIQPVNNLNIDAVIPILKPVSPVVFTWTTPQSVCGLPTRGYNYDLEIREIFNTQTVTDAINNPFVFRKISLPSSTFLLDTNLYRNVLQEGKQYIIRVKANAVGITTPAIENNGYSRVEAFRYGGNSYSSKVPDPKNYYIAFNERKGNLWDDIKTAYDNGKRGDTLVPIKEYIAFALTQYGTAYNLDAIELFLVLNPDLAEVKKVKISYVPKLPEFPPVQGNDQGKFDKEHLSNLEPDRMEENKFLNYLDTLNNYKQKIPGNVTNLVNDLVGQLNNIKSEMYAVDRVSINYINMVLAEFLYELRLNSQDLNKNQYNQLQSLVITLKELTAQSPNSNSFIYPFPVKERSSLSSYHANTIGEQFKKISLANCAWKIYETDSLEYIWAAIMKQLLPYEVVVWRNSKELPSRPVLDAPDLTAAYRVFYALSNLYNHKNPEINAKSTTRLASTVQVSLPSNAVFSFWTLNMLNHKTTKAQEVDLKNVLLHTLKILHKPKKLTIVLKVD